LPDYGWVYGHQSRRSLSLASGRPESGDLSDQVGAMGQKLTELREALGRFAAAFDAALLTPADAALAVSEASRIEKMAATVKMLAAARAAQSHAWKRSGYRSAAEALAHQTGTTVGQARDALETGQRLETQPDVADAARAGELSPTQTSMICTGALADPNATHRLLETAKRTSLSELRDDVARTRAAAIDLEERRRQIHARRRLRSWTDVEGAWHLHATGNVEDGAQIMAALAPIANDLFRATCRREAPEACAFDALVQLAGATSSGLDDARPPGSTRSDAPGPEPPPAPIRPPRRQRRRRGTRVKLLVRIDYDAWLRGVAVADETCELVGYGPVPVSLVEDLVARRDPFVAAILTRGKALVGVAHLGRQPTATQQSALEWLYPACAAEGCPVQTYLERDHRVDWSRTHFTVLDLLDRLCSHHHRLKTRENWALVSGIGKRPFVSPADPRHPDYSRRRARVTSGSP
jgi:hypothetical protein